MGPIHSDSAILGWCRSRWWDKVSSGGGSYLVAMQNVLCREDGIPKRLRQLLTTVILYPAAVSIGFIVVDHTGFADDVQKERVFSMM